MDVAIEDPREQITTTLYRSELYRLRAIQATLPRKDQTLNGAIRYLIQQWEDAQKKSQK